MPIDFSLVILNSHHGWLSYFAQTSWPILNLTTLGDDNRNVKCLLLLLASNELFVVRDFPITVLFRGDDDAAAYALVDVVVVEDITWENEFKRVTLLTFFSCSLFFDWLKMLKKRI